MFRFQFFLIALLCAFNFSMCQDENNSTSEQPTDSTAPRFANLFGENSDSTDPEERFFGLGNTGFGGTGFNSYLLGSGIFGNSTTLCVLHLLSQYSGSNYFGLGEMNPLLHYLLASGAEFNANTISTLYALQNLGMFNQQGGQSGYSPLVYQYLIPIVTNVCESSSNPSALSTYFFIQSFLASNGGGQTSPFQPSTNVDCTLSCCNGFYRPCRDCRYNDPCNQFSGGPVLGK